MRGLRLWSSICWAALTLLPLVVWGQSPAYSRATLPQDHEYQRVLYKFMATVTEQDTAHGVTSKMEIKEGRTDPEYLYRNYLLTLMHQPLVGTKRGYPAINSAPIGYTLKLIEQPDGVYYTNAWPETLISFVQWDYPGNPYFNNRALKMRAFMAAAANMLMFHDFAEHNDRLVPSPIRPDQHGYNPVYWAMPYPGFKEVLPPEVQQAYETGLRMIGERIMSWGIRGDASSNDYIAPVGLLYIARAINDPEFMRRVEAHTRPLYTTPRYFHSAGYWDERGGIDTGFSGAANWFAVWTGLLTDWPFVKESVGLVYRLRGHLLLPEPDGTATGPSHFNSRLGSPVNSDQWHWDGARDAAAAMLTDEAAHFFPTPTAEQLAASPGNRANTFANHIRENPVRDGKFITNEELLAEPKMPMKWSPRVWMSYNFPASVNYGYEHYRPDAWARRQALEDAKSPLLKPPFLRGENFVRTFDKDFVITRQPNYGAILHTGPLGMQSPNETRPLFPGTLGLSGGQVSAFWTPKTGSVLLGLRMGMSSDKSFDVLDDWRTWPTHAVMGRTTSGRVITSARVARPQTDIAVNETTSSVKVSGPLVALKVIKDPKPVDPMKVKDQMFDEPLAGSCAYSRRIETDEKGVSVETTLDGAGDEPLTELWEVLPVYLGHPRANSKVAPTQIEFLLNGQWLPASDTLSDGVQAVRLTRFEHSVVVTFAAAQRVKLAPAEWKDNWLNVGAMSRNVLIDLLKTSDKPVKTNATKIGYRIEPVATNN